MPQIIYTDKSRSDLQRLAEFMESVAPHIRDKMIDHLLSGISQLLVNPRQGKPSDRKPFRELVIPFGRSAYIVLYQYNRQKDLIIIARLRHGKEKHF